ncbi:hypothetical protein SmJEL517_g05465 [Synchytrium microbalum]|uniref:DUF1446-domain-containing protein n=1 Tax=Synchytrium microbalum TaxID=1806994 RepID=A0A507BL84_9FUNG|nr:uncharacterized protein SmJEL517_g05465 [Synchytrium microbalum]TPX31150.1 hypothetical protein SmJEL517_g05465 [Synchytrium microbalum]
MTPKRPVIIANCSGMSVSRDRMVAMKEQALHSPDVITGDYLAEFNLAFMASSPKGRYEQTFLAAFNNAAQELATRKIKLVVNAGGMDPAGLAKATRDVLRAKNLSLKVAHIEGDNIMPLIPKLLSSGHELRNLDSGQPFRNWGKSPVSANGYLGGWGICEALKQGADIVICGRVADASLVVGACAWWHSWKRTDFDALAGAMVAGHVIECSGHAVGGMFSGFKDIKSMKHLGYPVAEVAHDGSTVITKYPNTNGRVTVHTVTAQIIYEIQGPAYLNSDVTSHFDSIHIEEIAPDRVLLSHVKGSAPPPTTKVAINAIGGYQNELSCFATGLDIEEKCQAMEELVLGELDPENVKKFDYMRFQLVGAAKEDPETQDESTVRIRITVQAKDRKCIDEGNWSRPILGASLTAFPGFYVTIGRPPSPIPFYEYFPALIPYSELKHQVVLEDGRIVAVPPTLETAIPPHHPADHQIAPTKEFMRKFGPTKRAPLGRIVHGRAGDKGSNSNIGLWVETDEAYEWLRNFMSTAQLRTYLAKELDMIPGGCVIDRCEFPRLRAVHFILRGYLGCGSSNRGVMGNHRLDAFGKAVAEFVRARYADIPVSLLESSPLGVSLTKTIKPPVVDLYAKL